MNHQKLINFEFIKKKNRINNIFFIHHHLHHIDNLFLLFLVDTDDFNLFMASN